jgi:uncharacterized protein (TIGR02391 family)
MFNRDLYRLPAFWAVASSDEQIPRASRCKKIHDVPPRRSTNKQPSTLLTPDSNHRHERALQTATSAPNVTTGDLTALVAVQYLASVRHSAMARTRVGQPPIEPREFRSVEEIDSGIAKLERRIRELEELDVKTSYLESTGAHQVAESNVRTAILEVFGPYSPEFNEHKFIELFDGVVVSGMSDGAFIQAMDRGRVKVIGILKGLVGRLREKREDLAGGATPAPSTYFDRLNLHPRILDVSRDLFIDGHPWEAVFAAAKALVNYVKDRSGTHDLDGAPLVRKVFSANSPILAFNDLTDQVDRDEQEGMMHLFEGAVLAIRNPGGHSFPEGTEQRAIEHISLLSLLAYRVQEAKRRKSP